MPNVQENTYNGIVFRPLTAEETECRVAGKLVPKSGPGSVDGRPTYYLCPLLIYKDARVDQKLLDEVVGRMNWKRDHRIEQGRNFCTVSIWDQGKNEWISKTDVGAQTKIEELKGEASDAFKRACFNWGIGRELYSSPDIYVYVMPYETDGKNVFTRFKVTKLETDEKNGVIKKIEIKDESGNVRYTYSRKEDKSDRMKPTGEFEPVLRPGGKDTGDEPQDKPEDCILSPANPDWPKVVAFLKNPANDSRLVLANYAITDADREKLRTESGRTIL